MKRLAILFSLSLSVTACQSDEERPISLEESVKEESSKEEPELIHREMIDTLGLRNPALDKCRLKITKIERKETRRRPNGKKRKNCQDWLVEIETKRWFKTYEKIGTNPDGTPIEVEVADGFYTYMETRTQEECRSDPIDWKCSDSPEVWGERVIINFRATVHSYGRMMMELNEYCLPIWDDEFSVFTSDDGSIIETCGERKYYPGYDF